MAQKTWTTGDVLTASDLNTYASHEGGAWTTFTPTLTQSGAVTKTVTRASYAKASRLIHFEVNLAVTGSGTGSNVITVSLPVNATNSTGMICGTGFIFDTSGSAKYFGPLFLASASTVKIADPGSGNVFLGEGTATFASALASGDVVYVAGFYEAAS